MARHARRLILWTTGVLLSLALLAILGIALLVWGVDPDVFRPRIERAASSALGRRVELTGALHWRPGLNLRIESLGGTIANAPGFGSSPLASWRSLQLGVALRPLLDRRLVIDHIQLEGMQLNLARSAQGVNWNLPPAADSGNKASDLTLAIGSVGLADATVRFSDEVGGHAWSATGLELDVDLPAQLDTPILSFTGLSLRTRLNGAPLAPTGVALQVNVPRLDFESARSHIAAPQWQVEWNDAKFSGAIDATLGESVAAKGSLRAEGPSLRRLLESASVAVPNMRDAGAAGPFSFSLRFAASANAAEVNELQARLDTTQLSGQVRLPTLSPLSVRFQLAADQVELDRYLTPEKEPGTPLHLPLAQLKALDAKGALTIRRATLAGAVSREMRIDVD
jgi:AsmA protein